VKKRAAEGIACTGDTMPPDNTPQTAAELLEKVPLNVLSRKERVEALKASENLSRGRITLDEQIDEYVRAGRQVLEKIQYLSAWTATELRPAFGWEREGECEGLPARSAGHD
jgi:hypothetical protein